MSFVRYENTGTVSTNWTCVSNSKYSTDYINNKTNKTEKMILIATPYFSAIAAESIQE